MRPPQAPKFEESRPSNSIWAAVNARPRARRSAWQQRGLTRRSAAREQHARRLGATQPSRVPARNRTEPLEVHSGPVHTMRRRRGNFGGCVLSTARRRRQKNFDVELRRRDFICAPTKTHGKRRAVVGASASRACVELFALLAASARRAPPREPD